MAKEQGPTEEMGPTLSISVVTASGNQEKPAQPVQKVLFLPAMLKGHTIPMMGLVEWFVAAPGFEAHVWLGGSLSRFVPHGAILHEDFGVNKDDEWLAYWEKCFRSVCHSKDWYSSMANLVGALDPTDDVVNIYFVGQAKMVNKLLPDLVVADNGGSFHLAGLCARKSIVLVGLRCMGRPESLEKPSVALHVLMDNPSVMMKLAKKAPAFKRLFKNLEAETGPALFKPKVLQLMPGSQALVKTKQLAHEVFVGPFLPIPDALDVAGPIDAGLLSWLEALDTPIVYVAFGTIAAITDDMGERFAVGLQGGPWRVLWSLPEAQQARLPQSLHGVTTAAWRVEPFVPQPEVLKHHCVKCFVSHCGQNSIHESIASGIPMVCVPFFCDQFEWASSICKDVKAGVRIDKLKSSSVEISKAVATVLQDESYRRNARAHGDAMRKARDPASAVSDTDIGANEAAGVPFAAHFIIEQLRKGPVQLKAKDKSCCSVQ